MDRNALRAVAMLLKLTERYCGVLQTARGAPRIAVKLA